MASPSSYIYYTHGDPEVTTVSEFLDQFGLSIAKAMSVDEFLTYEDEFGVTNLDRIWSTYDKYEKQASQTSYAAGTLTKIKPFTVFVLPKDRLAAETLAITGANQLSGDLTYAGFMSRQLRDLLTSDRAVSTIKFHDVVDITTTVEHPYISVWIWSRALNKLINISPFVESCDTNVDANGGNFTLSLASIEGTSNDSGIDFRDGSAFGTLFEFNSISSFDLNPSREGKRTVQFFEQAIQSNDLVFIRYERLICETDRVEPLSIEIDPSNIPSSIGSPKIYDMIALVDSCRISSGSESESITVSVSGKDLSKLLIDDASYFYPLAFAQNVFINKQEQSKLIKRLAVSGEFILQSKLAYRSIRWTVQYIINHLANIGVVPDDLFTSYGQRRTSVYRLDLEATHGSNQSRERLRNEIANLTRSYVLSSNPDALQVEIDTTSSLVLEFIDTCIASNALINTSGIYSGYRPVTFNGELVSTNTTPIQISNRGVYLWKTVDDGSLTGKIQPTLIMQRLLEYAASTTGTPSQVIETPAKGVWQIVKLIFDQSIVDRRVADPSISQPDGSLMAQMRKIAQEPFVEFFTDTYGDLFYFIFRQPPFTKQAVLDYINTTVRVDQDNIVEIAGDKNRSIVIDIEQYEAFSDDLSFDDRCYSFYEIRPQGLFLGQGSEVSLAYIPIVYFPQYAEIWGAKRMSVVSNYIPYSGISGYNSDKTKNYIVEQAVLDLQFVIDTNAYLPFTRRGSITLYGNRSIKRGTWIRYKATGEIFYVTSVSQSIRVSTSGVDRMTTISVERGMVEKYIDGPINYFNIVDSELIKQYIVSYLQNKPDQYSLGAKLQSNYGINQAVFDFFIQRKQYV